MDYHPPEVLFSMRQGPLRRYKRLIIPMNRAINIISIDIAVRDVGATLDEANSCVFEGLEVCVSV